MFTLLVPQGFYVFIRALQILKSHNEGVVVVGLAGASGSGKTAFSEKVKSFMPGITVISMDMYNDATKLVDSNFDDPRLTDYDCLLENLRDLRAGKSVQVPIYDFKQSRRVGYTTLDVPSSRVVIIEGIYALSDRLKPLLDLRVSITGGVHFDLVKRVLRDVNRSGQGPDEIIQQITDTVYPMYKAFIEPDLQTAQLRIYNAFNPFSGFMNATYILKSATIPSLEKVKQVLEADQQLSEGRDAEMYDIYLLPPHEDPETCQCWLRMRNRDGRYSLMFEEWVTEGPFVISPRIAFEVSVRVLGGLMALGYEIGTIMKRTSTSYHNEEVSVKFDDIEGLGQFVQVQGKDRDKVAAVGKALGLEGSYIPKSYIEQVQMGKLTTEFANVTEEMKKRLSASGDPLDQLLGSSPTPSFLYSSRSASLPNQTLSSSAPVAIARKSTRQVAGEYTEKLNGTASTEVPSSSSTTTAGAGPNGTSRSSSNTRPSGLLGQQLRQPSPSSGGERAVSNGGNGETDRGPQSPRWDSISSQGISPLQWKSLKEKLDVLSEHVHRYSGLTLQMDAMIHQYRVMNEELAKVSQVTSRLADVVDRWQQEETPPLTRELPLVSNNHWLWVGGLGCVLTGALLGYHLRRR